MDAKAEKIKAMKLSYNNQPKDNRQSGANNGIGKNNDINKAIQAQQEE